MRDPLHCWKACCFSKRLDFPLPRLAQASAALQRFPPRPRPLASGFIRSHLPCPSVASEPATPSLCHLCGQNPSRTRHQGEALSSLRHCPAHSFPLGFRSLTNFWKELPLLLLPPAHSPHQLLQILSQSPVSLPVVCPHLPQHPAASEQQWPGGSHDSMCSWLPVHLTVCCFSGLPVRAPA